MLALSATEKIIIAAAALLTLLGLSVSMGASDAPKPAQPTVVTSYEDGSVVWSDGTTSCDPDALCSR